jgi:hypothetical protein
MVYLLLKIYQEYKYSTKRLRYQGLKRGRGVGKEGVER